MSDRAGPGQPTPDPTVAAEGDPTVAAEELPGAPPAPEQAPEADASGPADGEAPEPEPAGSMPDPDLDPAPADAPAPDSAVEPQPGPGEQIEWQPVVGGDHIEWQPVVASDVGAEKAEDAGPEPTPGPPTEPTWADPDSLAAPLDQNEQPAPEAEAAWPPEGEVGQGGGEWEQEAEYPSEPEFEYPVDEAEAAPEWAPEATAVPTESPVAGNGAASGAPAPASRPGRPATERPRAAGPGGFGPSPPEPYVPPGESGDGDRRAKTRRQVVILAVLTAIVVAVAILGFVLSRDATEKGEQAATPGTTSPSPTTGPTLPESALQTYKDELTGFTLKFAKTWEILRAPNADIRLVVNAGGNDGLQVRVAPIETPATTQNIGNFKAVTDAIVLGDRSARLIQEQLVTVNGLLAYYYVYTFQDPISNQEGVHAQYFIFEGQRMFMLVFQTVPTQEFPRQAGLWDQVAESFTVEPRPATALTTAPTTTPATTVP